MSTVRISDIISVDECLEGELVSRMKHEYIAGAVLQWLVQRTPTT